MLFIGAGEMIELCATHFAAQAPARITVANRTLERARGARAPLQRPGDRAARRCAEHLHEYDIVVSCTASSLPILGKGLVERALRARRRRPMFMVDLAVPRDIEPEVGRAGRRVPLHRRRPAASIVAGQPRRAPLGGRAGRGDHRDPGRPVHALDAGARERCRSSAQLREQAEEARRQELERALKALARGEDPAQVLEALSQGLTNKLLHGPTQALNEAAGEERRALAELLERLYRAK